MHKLLLYEGHLTFVVLMYEGQRSKGVGCVFVVTKSNKISFQ